MDTKLKYFGKDKNNKPKINIKIHLNPLHIRY